MLIKKEYIKQVKLSKTDLIPALFKSNEFKIEYSTSYGGQLYTEANISRTYLRIVDDNELQFSENAGLGGMFEIMGRCKINFVTENTTELRLKFTMGIFPVNLSIYLCLICLMIGLSIIFSYKIEGIVLLSIALYLILFFLLKKYSVNYILKSFSKALSIDNQWA